MEKKANKNLTKIAKKMPKRQQKKAFKRQIKLL